MGGASFSCGLTSAESSAGFSKFSSKGEGFLCNKNPPLLALLCTTVAFSFVLLAVESVMVNEM